MFLSQVQDTVEKYMTENMEKNATVWDKLQTEFKCCGIHSAIDWNRTVLPESCCRSPAAGCNITDTDTFYPHGCLDLFTDWVKDHVNYVGFVGIGFAFIQVITV